MTTLHEAAQHALEACKLIVSAFDALKPASAARNEPLQINAARASITALEAALAEPQEPVAWLRVIDEAMVTHHLGVADPADDYETAKRKMNNLLCAAQDIGTYFAKQAEPQEPDSPERRCGGPGCDLKCCQPVQEPVAGVVLNEEGRAALVEHGREEWHCVVRNARRLYTAPQQRKPLTSDKDRPDQGATYVEGYGYVDTRAVRAVERAHGIGGEE